nr:hypothetical protein BDOA9_0203480 [Bradyrhizobium sp. DOA9]
MAPLVQSPLRRDINARPRTTVIVSRLFSIALSPTGGEIDSLSPDEPVHTNRRDQTRTPHRTRSTRSHIARQIRFVLLSLAPLVLRGHSTERHRLSLVDVYTPQVGLLFAS